MAQSHPPYYQVQDPLAIGASLHISRITVGSPNKLRGVASYITKGARACREAAGSCYNRYRWQCFVEVLRTSHITL